MAAETIRPGAALVDLWDKGADPAEARRKYDALGDDVRAVINLWATFGPEKRTELLARMEAEQQG